MPKYRLSPLRMQAARHRRSIVCIVGAVVALHVAVLSRPGRVPEPVRAGTGERGIDDSRVSVRLLPTLAITEPRPAPASLRATVTVTARGPAQTGSAALAPVPPAPRAPKRVVKAPADRHKVRPSLAGAPSSLRGSVLAASELEPATAVDGLPPQVASAAEMDVSAAADMAMQTVAASAAESNASEIGESESKTYRTRVPASFTLKYQMERGAFSGTGELQWQNAGDHYAARLQGSIAGLTVLNWNSTGGFDSAGISPVRYTDQRLGKAAQAANFQRAESKITFSGPSVEYPLVPGAQDRLSWMIQLPSILMADPSKAKAGTRVVVYIVGARGDAETWAFQSAGPEDVTIPAGTVRSVKWLREPRKPFDTRVEVWLDPARQYLPVRARLTAPPSDSPLELRLVEAG